MELWNYTSSRRLATELIETKWELISNMGWKWLAFHPETKLIVQYFPEPNRGVGLLGFIVYNEICNQLNCVELLPEYRQCGYGGRVLDKLFEYYDLEFLTITEVLPSGELIWEIIFDRDEYMILEKKENTWGTVEYKICYKPYIKNEDEDDSTYLDFDLDEDTD